MSAHTPPMDEDDIIERLKDENDELRTEIMEQCRLYAISATREAGLIAQINEAKKKVDDLTAWVTYWKDKAQGLQKAIESVL